MTVVHPIPSAWLTKGGTGAQNYDEFADEAEITEIIAANPLSALAVEMPHKAPDSLGKSFEQSLPDAVSRLAAAKAQGAYGLHDNVVVLYRITGETVSYGLWCMVDTDQISTSVDEPGLVIRNEDVFPEKVRERVALADALGHLLSPVLLLQTGRGEELHTALALACEDAGAPLATDVDPSGRKHEIWPVSEGMLATRLTELAGGGDLVVADGNHRSLAAQTGGLPRFLAVVTTPDSVTIQPYNRLVRDVSLVGGEYGGRVRVYTREDGERVLLLPEDPSLGFVENMDHARVERVLLGEMLGLEPGDKRITYVGGDYPDSWLRGEVDAGRADLAVLIEPVTVPDFIQVNLDRQKMPRKSTWFTPKARAGLVVAELG